MIYVQLNWTSANLPFHWTHDRIWGAVSVVLFLISIVFCSAWLFFFGWATQYLFEYSECYLFQ